MSDIDKVFEVLGDILMIDQEECLDDSGPDEIPTWDSLATIRLATELSDTFSIEIDPEEMTAWLTIGDIKATLKQKGLSL